MTLVCSAWPCSAPGLSSGPIQLTAHAHPKKAVITATDFASTLVLLELSNWEASQLLASFCFSTNGLYIESSSLWKVVTWVKGDSFHSFLWGWLGENPGDYRGTVGGTGCAWGSPVFNLWLWQKVRRQAVKYPQRTGVLKRTCSCWKETKQQTQQACLIRRLHI